MRVDKFRRGSGAGGRDETRNPVFSLCTSLLFPLSTLVICLTYKNPRLRGALAFGKRGPLVEKERKAHTPLLGRQQPNHLCG